ncbi:hypothetical protein SDC9_159563 [bioreactor metagenome]|uniref:Uncharacterized protein n=1 Tax=bioreactor metagenome TaxID=1076179 RepID=A0A645FFX2_9ZZZZ
MHRDKPLRALRQIVNGFMFGQVGLREIENLSLLVYHKRVTASTVALLLHESCDVIQTDIGGSDTGKLARLLLRHAACHHVDT